ncbi:MAG: hypothetical protein DRQ47_03545 [Gammaproteobacteria bacterium]|nr:MAG: hypothetical protein DRQ47_03545 [Gammaproteobacteria bacterium]
MKNYKLIGFIIRSVVMGMIAALFLFTFFPHLMSPVTVSPEKPAPAKLPLSFADAIQQTSKSVVNIRTLDPEPKKRNTQSMVNIGMGSGVIISAQGYIVTNYHVISKADEIAIELADGRRTIANIIGFDAATDLAVLKITMDNLPSIEMKPDVKVQVGDVALVIGNPFGVGQSVSMGIVSATGRRFLGLSEYEDYIQTDAAVNLGNSGGALINTNGDLLGISSAYFTFGTKTGISFAIPTSLAMGVIEQIIFNGRVIRGWLGFEAGPISKAGREKFGGAGYIIIGISPGGPADIAGLKVNDIITGVGNGSVGSITNLHNMIAESKPGSEIEINLKRNNQPMSLKVMVKERPQPINGRK